MVLVGNRRYETRRLLYSQLTGTPSGVFDLSKPLDKCLPSGG